MFNVQATNGLSESEESSFVGIIPAAGLGSRLNLGYPKELLPITFELGFTGSGLTPKPVMAYSLELMQISSVKKVCVVLSDRKFEIARVFGDGAAHQLSLCYTIRNLPRGLADAVDAASPWTIGKNVSLTLPDTIVKPASAMRETCELLQQTNADVVLGVFPTNTPELLGPVRLGQHDTVIQVFDKPKNCDLNNTWGIAAWGPRFTKFLANINGKSVEALDGPIMGEVFQAAIECGLDVRAKYFPSGRFFDLGTPSGLEEFLHWSLSRRTRMEHREQSEPASLPGD